MTKEYICKCGKVFIEPNKFNSHKSHCKIHLGEDRYNARYKHMLFMRDRFIESTRKRHENLLQIKEQSLLEWVSEQHTCEKCGKIMTKKFGSGRFCSRHCSNSRNQTDEVNAKRSVSAKNTATYKKNTTTYYQDRAEKYKLNYYKNPNICVVCGSILDYDDRRRKTCSDNCLSIRLRENAKNNKLGGLQEITSWGKRGTYKGIHCDSRYELAYLVFCIDHDIEIIRNNKYFYYMNKEGVKRKYYPDFYLPKTDTYVETKGYEEDKDITQIKLNSVIEAGARTLLLRGNDLKVYFDYIKDTYGLAYDKIDKLYDTCENLWRPATIKI